jgi:MFS family permease
VAFRDVRTRARYFGVVSSTGGLGAATGPLIGDLVTTLFSWHVVPAAGPRHRLDHCVDPPDTRSRAVGSPPRFHVTGRSCPPVTLTTYWGANVTRDWSPSASTRATDRRGRSCGSS